MNALIKQHIEVDYTKVADVANPAVREVIDRALRLVSGTSNTGQADRLFVDTRNLAASATENLDLAGALVDPFGDAAVFGEVVAIYVEAAATNTNNVVVGGAASNPWVGPIGATGTFIVKPGENMLFVSKTGWPVVAATGDLLKVLNSGAGTGVDYTIVVIGRSVAA